MHAQLSITHIHRPCTKGSREHWPDSRTARTVIPHNKELKRDLCPPRNLLGKDDTRRVCGIPAIGVDLDNRALVHLWAVVALVLEAVRGVIGVGLVARPKMGLDKSLLEDGRRGFRAVACEGGETTDDGGEEVRVGALGGLGANLLMVEEGNETDGVIILEGVRGFERLDDCDDGAVGHHLIVQAGRENKLVMDTTSGGGMGVVEQKLKIDNGLGANAGSFGDRLDDDWVVPCREGSERRELGIIGLGLLARSRLVELGGGSRGKAEDREELSLLVEGESLLAVKVNSESWDTENRLLDVNELRDKLVALPHHNPSGKTEVTVEP